ncbi:hypothetical protein NM688_g9431 [Phlebia brevispora]|uniref:Uncharacterized protein n=1 Tax=Phlebia brevispora TaxID=194682 RepID=A0ACC1RH09_9APHY|nr:hypothetical protein NM688_g9431 [Phlebia brevispora]
MVRIAPPPELFIAAFIGIPTVASQALRHGVYHRVSREQRRTKDLTTQSHRMVSADNLNLDCLELIFQYLSGNDLVAVSLVSKSFLAGVVPHLYRSLVFHTGNCKRYPKVLSPFEVILRDPSLAVHVRSIDIRTIPIIKGAVHAKFLANCQRAITLCANLRSFTCTPNVLPSFLLVLEKLENVENIRVNATITQEQAKHLVSLKKLRSISLETCSWNVVDILPSWVSCLPTLTTLTFFSVQELHEQILRTILGHVPQLKALHVMGCTKIEHTDVLRAITHTPDLETLSITAWDSQSLSISVPSLTRLRHLTVDTHAAMTVGPAPVATPGLWMSIITATRSWSCPLQSITLRLSDRWPIHRSFIQDLVNAHGTTLKHIAMLDSELEMDSIRLITSRCTVLEGLAIYVPKKDLTTFNASLALSKTLKVLGDVGESHMTHGAHPFLKPSEVTTMMWTVPTLRKVSADGRIWLADKPSGWKYQKFQIRLEKRRTSTPAYWFMPPVQLS